MQLPGEREPVSYVRAAAAAEPPPGRSSRYRPGLGP
uniref:Uncharacterized protein n=2 Tax=Cricetidae TaxID=337677 RepID=A0A8C2LFL2_CRIGR